MPDKYFISRKQCQCVEGKSPDSPRFRSPSHLAMADNGYNQNKRQSSFKIEEGITVARQSMIYTWFLINSRQGKPTTAMMFTMQRTNLVVKVSFFHIQYHAIAGVRVIASHFLKRNAYGNFVFYTPS
jgi:hypothetical protein